MSTKEKLIEKIQNIDDESLLAEIIEMVEMELSVAGDLQLTNDQQASVDEGLKDVDEGRTLSDQDVRKITSQWFEGK